MSNEEAAFDFTMSRTLETLKREFTELEEATPLEPRWREFKCYAPEIELVRDGDLKLVKHGQIRE